MDAAFAALVLVGMPTSLVSARLRESTAVYGRDMTAAKKPDAGMRLDFIYLPSKDVAKDLKYFTDVLGARFRFAVDGMGARVALVELGDAPPHLLLTDHLVDDRPVLIYRVGDLGKAVADLSKRKWKRAGTFEIPHGPCCSFITPGGQRIALYELTRPGAAASFEGRRDF